MAEYPGSRGSFSKYLVGSKPCLPFDKAPETDLWSHKEATSFLCEKSVQNLNWVADWLLPRPQGINAVTVNLIGCIEKLHRMKLKPVAIAIFIRNNLIPGRNSEISAFTFTLGSVANQSLSKRRNNLSEHPTTESTLLEEEALFELFLPKDVL